MWRDDGELTAPAIVISSLGGLVYGKDSLTPKDEHRACMLRKALKKQLGRPRGPRPRGQSCVDREYASEILHHRVLASEGGGANINSYSEENKGGFCAPLSSNLGARRQIGPPSNSSAIEARASHKSGWKVQGQIAGEWRDRQGRHRRARPSENANTNAIAVSGSALAAADASMISSIPNSSCAGSEVSFEGLVDELRERLPRASLLAGFAATQRQTHHHVCPGVDKMVTGTITSNLGEQEDALRKHRQDGGSGRFGGNTRRAAPSTAASTAGGGNRRSDPDQQRGEEERGLMMPPGCLGLRHPLIGTMREHPNSQHDTRQNSQPRLNHVDGVGPQPSLIMPPGGLLFPDGSAYRLVTMDAAGSENASPSAAMVAAAKAQERALPLLQVCAVKVAESTSS